VTTSSTDITQQADYYDHHIADAEFEINRPHGESRFYNYLMDFKFRHVIELLGKSLTGTRVLVVCCGSGMDAEYVYRAGASVVALDISLGCLERARARAKRYNVTYDLVKGDAEHLPFDDGSFDYGFVHDGLHHLSNPDRALKELARVSTRGVIVTEPARARLTNLLIRVNLAEQYEEAGNYVMRLEPSQMAAIFRSLGFDRVASRRYLLKYGHPPGRWWRVLDSAPLFSIGRAAFTVFGVTLFGRWGNKLAFVAERSTMGSAG
jgi:ubiquinone/menaquinone biosynthesis C-methylase UbiE